MRYTIVLAISVTLITACQKQSAPSDNAKFAPTGLSPMDPNEVAPPDAPPIAAWGATKDQILVKLDQMGAKIVTNTDSRLVSEVEPEGLIDSHGKPVHLDRPVRTEYHFKDGKLASTKELP